MKSKTLLLLALLAGLNTYGQIFVQTVGYWDKNESYSFDCSYEKIKVKNNDSIKEVQMTYELDIKILDSTANSYTIEWLYKNFKYNSNNNLLSKVMPHIKGDIKVVFKTDELGTFQQIENLDEIIKTYSNYIS